MALVLTVAMSLSIAVPAFAAEADEPERTAIVQDGAFGGEGAVPLLDYTHTIGPNWVTIATGGDLTGVGVRIDVHNFNWALHQVNVRYYRNGVLMPYHNSYDNVTKAGSTASITCATGATEVQMQIVPRFWGVQDHWYHVSITR